MIIYETAKTENDYNKILELQRQNLPYKLSNKEAKQQGFVTLEHNVELLKKICGHHAHVIALDERKIIGYALVMVKEYSSEIPLLISMFNQINKISSIDPESYVVMGQICIAKEYRGMGIFKGLYEKLKLELQGHFRQIITEVATSNVRSIGAHNSIGFQSIHRYTSDEKTWELICLNW